jgi:3',5'-cyclic AMP phosphodiesterase CpdA
MKLFRRLLFLAIIGGLVWISLFYQAEVRRFFFPSPPSEAPVEKPLEFAVMSDIHLDAGNFKIALEKAKADGEDFVIIVGDLTSLGKKEELSAMKKILDESGLKYYAIPGNHDLWASNQKKGNLFRQVFGPDFQSFKRDNFKFILVDNGSFSGIDAILGEDGQSQGVWLKKELVECPQIDCLVFMHIPLNHPRSFHIMGEENPQVALEAKKWAEVLVESEVKEVFAGHLHFFSSYTLDGLETTVVGAITGNRNPQSPKFLRVIEEGSKLDQKEVFLND